MDGLQDIVRSQSSESASPYPANALPEWTRRLLTAFRVEEVSAEIAESALRECFGSHADDRTFAAAFAAGVRENITLLRGYLLGDIDLDSCVPSQPVVLASIQAQLDIRESEVHHSYRIGYGILLEYWVGEVTRFAATTSLDSAEAIKAIRAFISAVLRFHGCIVGSVAEALAHERTLLRTSTHSRKRQIIQDVLANECFLSTSELSLVLEYEIDAQHLAAVVDGPERRVARIIRAVTRPDCETASVTLALSAGRTALWVGATTPWTFRSREDVRDLLLENDFRVSFSSPAFGLDGFVRALHQANQTEMVREAWGGVLAPALSFDEVALEALAMSDVGAAREMVQTELGRLGASTRLCDDLRMTLSVWFASGTHVSTAARLGLNEHTVRNRLRRIEEMIGHPLSQRRTELQVALRLYPLVAIESDHQRGST